MIDRVTHAGERTELHRVHPDAVLARSQRLDRGLDGADGTQQQAEQPPGGRGEDAEPHRRRGQVEGDQLSAGAREIGGGEAQHHASGLDPRGFSALCGGPPSLAFGSLRARFAPFFAGARPSLAFGSLRAHFARLHRSHEQHRVAAGFGCAGREGHDLGGARAREVGSRGPGSGQLGLGRGRDPARPGDQTDLEHAIHRGQWAEQRGEPIRVLGGQRLAGQDGELPRLGPALARQLGPDPAPGHHDHHGRADQQARSRDRRGESDAEIEAAPRRLSRLAHLRSPEGGSWRGDPESDRPSGSPP